VATGKVVSRILLPRDELLWVEELAVRASAHLIDDSGLKVDKDGPRHMLARTGLTEEGVEGIMCDANRGITASQSNNPVLEKIR
jgi:hypothetical protein